MQIVILTGAGAGGTRGQWAEVTEESRAGERGQWDGRRQGGPKGHTALIMVILYIRLHFEPERGRALHRSEKEHSLSLSNIQ